MVCVVPITGVPEALVDHEYESYPLPEVKVVLEPHKITFSLKTQSISAKKFVDPGFNKHPEFLLKLGSGSSEIMNVGFSVPLYVENA